MKNRKILVRGIGIFTAVAVLLSAVLTAWILGRNRNLTLEKIAYDRSWKNPVVYIREHETYVPYLVLTADYDGNVLLLRENLLPEPMQYEPSEYVQAEGALSGGWTDWEYGAYYEESSIDAFLNTQFPEVFSPEVQAAIVDTTIEVTDKASYEEESWGNVTHMIERKVFLLSAVELGVKSGIGYTMTEEGTPLNYFRNKEYAVKVAYMADGAEWPYWTRTPHIWEEYLVTVMGPEEVGVGCVTPDHYIGVRPAFCMERDTVVKKSDEIVAGETVYILELDDG